MCSPKVRLPRAASDSIEGLLVCLFKFGRASSRPLEHNFQARSLGRTQLDRNEEDDATEAWLVEIFWGARKCHADNCRAQKCNRIGSLRCRASELEHNPIGLNRKRKDWDS